MLEELYSFDFKDAYKWGTNTDVDKLEPKFLVTTLKDLSVKLTNIHNFNPL